MNSLAKWETYAPYGVGLESLFRQLDNIQDAGVRTNFPPYNIIEQDKDCHYIEIALAGYNQKDLEVSVERNILTVTGPSTEDPRTYKYRGIANRAFTRSWTLGNATEVDVVTYNQGMLRIYLRRNVPEEQKKKILPIK